ncbi:mitochondrial dicarboxylate carrier [Drosophila virilis]|uniref:Mitochondrial dicarboxylate carrier n=1 Tax=Drosophila virilis TaxID=7244 RepID=B4LVR3_DROVI|nr:mitochondrial dicarboxylate carrier [Drosophila virilis]EDW67518.1 uncharacterized protein Dvir_GJ24196 [Drosophila virilis]
MLVDQRRISRWYFGGVASSMATMVTHPLDLLKVLIQTQKENLSILETTRKIVREQGVWAMYNGISASLLRQYTYTLSRFGLYTAGARMIDTTSMTSKVLLAAFGGAAGGFIGAPADLLNVRLQNDVKLPHAQRRNYKHAVDGLVRVCREEGCSHLFNGASIAATRGAFMTVGQIAFYEETKDLLVAAGFPSRTDTYIFASIISAIAATGLTQPIDVAKTRRMNARPGEYASMTDVFYRTALEGPMAFFKGSIPAFARLGPHTVLLFITLEFLRTHFGYLPDNA